MMRELVKELKENGHKTTPARLAILELFSKSKLPLDAESVYKKISKIKKLKNVNAATIYRTLTSLAASGLLKRIDSRKTSRYFELNQDHHHHIFCTNCDGVEDFKSLELEKILGRIVDQSSKFKNIKEHSLELFGLCRACA